MTEGEKSEAELAREAAVVREAESAAPGKAPAPRDRGEPPPELTGEHHRLPDAIWDEVGREGAEMRVFGKDPFAYEKDRRQPGREQPLPLPATPARVQSGGAARKGLTPRLQKEAFKALLLKRFSCVAFEAKFAWLKVPAEAAMDDVVRRVYRALAASRGKSGFATAGRSLCCDYCIPERRLIIEYDEFQHFTEQRAVALRFYPADAVYFDKARWISTCERIGAVDNDPPYRDEQRAFYDSLRDLYAARHGFTLVRLMHGDRNWADAGTGDDLEEILSPRRPD